MCPGSPVLRDNMKQGMQLPEQLKLNKVWATEWTQTYTQKSVGLIECDWSSSCGGNKKNVFSSDDWPWWGEGRHHTLRISSKNNSLETNSASWGGAEYLTLSPNQAWIYLFLVQNLLQAGCRQYYSCLSSWKYKPGNYFLYQGKTKTVVKDFASSHAQFIFFFL